MTDDNGFTYRYAIRRPDGALILQPKHSDIFGGLFGKTSEIDDYLRKPRTWDTREGAEAALREIREKAADMGIGEWLGAVVQQLCTPFTLHDPAEHFADEITSWLAGGAE